MNTVTLNQERFQLQDIPTRLNDLATHLDQIRSLVLTDTDSDKIVSLMRESRYYIEWIVPQFVDIDVDSSAELVDLGRVLTRWLFNWEKIWVDNIERTAVAQIAGSLSERVREVSSLVS
ncbi:MAG: hypothetical protein PUP93_31975 [Rhizonema sp. NSF051]|nr:hypothetical protein [Rhizonema sp. NSF051]